MSKNQHFMFGSRSVHKDSNIKLYLSILLFLIIVCAIIFYQFFSYKILIRDFISYFDENKFSNANNIIVTTENFNPAKKILLEKDLTTYFSDKLTSTNTKYNSGELSKSDALEIIDEISRYNIIIDDSLYLVDLTTASSQYDTALSLYTQDKFIDAYKAFSQIKPDDANYKESIDYMSKSKEKIKQSTLAESKKLANDHYYTQALALIDSVKDILGSDLEVSTAINDITKGRDTYLAQKNKESQASSSSIVNSISTTNINSLAIESLTPYLIYVNLNEQKTFVYKGQMNKWNLEKTMDCSTGIDSEATPNGVYTVKEKGEWFFSEEYLQGGKYWVQFMGDYLFHSVPYDRDKTTVLDPKLGVKASHGCIRLSLENSKWLYDNLAPGTKIIIK